MKTKLLILVVLLSPFTFRLSPCYAQVPSGFNYQAIARDGSGIALANQALPVKIAIQTSLTGGTLIYEELFSSVTSNQFGLISLVVGTGTQTGGSAASFSAIDWKAQTLFLKTIIQYPGTTWTTMGTSQIWGVPYSLVAKDVAGPLSKLGITGTTDVMDEALFEVKNKAGNTVFAVYNEGIRAYVGNGKAKGIKGGFSVGGYDATKGSTIYDLFTLSTDSARLYFDSKPAGKGIKGGFSIGGYDMTKGGIPVQDYFTVNKDSVRIYIDSNPLTKGKKGGFAVGGYDMTKGEVIQYLRVTDDSTRITTVDTLKGFGVGNLKSGNTLGYLRLTPSNYFIGHQAGKSITTGLYNSVIGYKAGYGLKTGISNSYIGYKAGYSGTSGNCNVILGNEAGYSNNGSNNTFIGFISGHNNTSGVTNSFFGDSTGFSNTWGWNNTFLGGRSGFANTSGHYNTFVGAMSGYRNSTGFSNTIVGCNAGQNNTTGHSNIMIGDNAGQNNTTGQDNMFIGFEAGKNSSTNYYNTSIGFQAGYNTSAGIGNLMVGFMAGYSNTGTYNVLLGDEAGYNNQANYNVFIGPQGPGQSNTTGEDNIMLGNRAGVTNTTGSDNVFMGGASGLKSNGDENTYLGAMSGTYNTTGSHNMFIGYMTGWSNINGSNNVFLGYRAGYYETGSNKLYIANSNTNPPLIFGDFSSGNVGIGTITPITKLEVIGTTKSVTTSGANAGTGQFQSWTDGSAQGLKAVYSFYPTFQATSDNSPRRAADIVSGFNGGSWGNEYLTFNVGYGGSPNDNQYLTSERMRIIGNGNVGIGTSSPLYKLHVNGSVAGVGAYNNISDIRFKKDIEPITGALEKIMALQGITFNWDRKTDSDFIFDDRNHLGFSAQDLEKVVPQVVSTANDKMQTKSIAYGDLVPLLTEAIKEQQKQISNQNEQIESQKLENQQLKSELQILKDRMERMEAMIADERSK
jgi:hypothetical protein